MQAITLTSIETTKVAIMVGSEAKNPVENARTAQETPRGSRPTLKQAKFNCKTPDKYHELHNL